MNIFMQFLVGGMEGEWYTYQLVRAGNTLEWSWLKCYRGDGGKDPLEDVPQSTLVRHDLNNFPYEECPL